MSPTTTQKKYDSETHMRVPDYSGEIAFLRMNSPAFKQYEEEIIQISTIEDLRSFQETIKRGY